METDNPITNMLEFDVFFFLSKLSVKGKKNLSILGCEKISVARNTTLNNEMEGQYNK